jgi:uncharacterized repeat protein (TIGR01451 family)
MVLPRPAHAAGAESDLLEKEIGVPIASLLGVTGKLSRGEDKDADEMPPYATSNYINQIVNTGLAHPGDVLTYTIILRNPETFPLTQVAVQDVFDSRLSDVQLISNSLGTGVVRGNTLTVYGFTLKPRQSIIIEVSAVVGNIHGGANIPNVASFTSPDTDMHVSNAVDVEVASGRLLPANPVANVMNGISRLLPVLIGVMGLGGSRRFSHRRRGIKGVQRPA